jgi:hypothetical protein
LPDDTNKIKSVLENPHIALEKVDNEIQIGRIAGPFQYSPISNLRFSPIGVIPKKTSGWRTNQCINVEKCSNVEHEIEQPIGKHLSR